MKTTQINPAVTITHFDDQSELMSHLEDILGFREVQVGDDFFVIPTDEEHPDFGICSRRIARARKKLARA